MTIDELYEAFMDEGRFADDPKSFGEDIFEFLAPKVEGKGWDAESWAKEYGLYLPEFDFGDIDLAKREQSLGYKEAMDTLRLTQKATDRVYATEMDTLSTALGREMTKGKEVASRIGLRSGNVETAIADTIALSGSKAKDLGDRLKISETETKDKYNIAMVDTALDFDKAKRAEKEEFYDRTMAALMRLEGKGAYEQAQCVYRETRDKACEAEYLQAVGGSYGGNTHAEAKMFCMQVGYYDFTTGEPC